jgi:hypothetical protein
MGINTLNKFLAACVALSFLTVVPLLAQAVRLRGTVSSMENDGLTMKTDAGEILNIQLAPNLKVQKVAPGEKDLTRAQEIGLSDLKAGDRILVRGLQDGNKVAAQSLIVMTARDIAQKNDLEQKAWQERGVLGVVEQVTPSSGEIRLGIRGTNGTTPIIVVMDANTQLKRYPPDSIRYADTIPARFEEIHVGDQLRALGTKDAAGTRLTAEKAVFGTFRTLAGNVAGIAVEENRLQLKDLMTGKTVIIHIKPTTHLKRMPDMPMGMMGGPSAGGPGTAPSGGGGAARTAASGSEAGQGNNAGSRGAGGAGWGGGMGGPGGAGSRSSGMPDLSRMIDRLPAISMGDLKNGEIVLLSSVPGDKPNEYTAIVVLAGVEPLLTRIAAMQAARNPSGGSSQLGSWPSTMTGAMDGMMGMPGM